MAFATNFVGNEYRTDNGSHIQNYPCDAALRATLPAGTLVKLSSSGAVVKASTAPSALLLGVVMHQVNGLNSTVAIGIRGCFNALPIDPSNLPTVGGLPYTGAGNGFVELITSGKDMTGPDTTVDITSMLRLIL